MSISDRFSRSNGTRNEQLNKQLAKEIVTARDQELVNEVIGVLKTSQSADVLSDGLKVVEMIGEEAPELVETAFETVLGLLDHQQNKIQWRAMSALSTFCEFHPTALYEQLGKILKIMDSGSVITRDHGVRILIMLYQKANYRNTLTQLLKEQILMAPDNQLGQYAEKWMAVIDREDIPLLIKQLEVRQQDLTSPSHQKRISRVLQQLNQLQKTR